MDDHAAILAALPGLEERLSRAGVREWLQALPRVTVEGRSFVVLGGDRLAGEAEAMLGFAVEKGLVDPEEVRRAAANRPLPPDVEAVDIETDDQGET